MSPERIAFITKLKARNLSPSTIKNYEHALVRLAKHYNKSPLAMNSDEIEKYLLHALEVDRLSPATVNLEIGAIKKFYALVAPENEIMKSIGKVKSVRKLPTVLTTDEIMKMIQCTENLKHRAVLELLYSSGIRLSECVNLRPGDINGKENLVHVINGKGGKERYTIIGDHALQTLRKYYVSYHPKDYLFEGRKHSRYSKRNLHNIITNAARLAGINKNVSPHTFRHSFATHLLEQNVNLCTIQKLLGHATIKTTTIYTHVSNATITKIINPLDLALGVKSKGGTV